MTRDSHSALWFLLGSGLPLAGCAATVEDEGDGGGGQQADADAAIAACRPYAKKISDCYASERPESDYGGYNYLMSLGYCIGYLGYGELAGGNCRAAMEDRYACLSTLECGELIEVKVSDSGSIGADRETNPCEAERTTVSNECPWSDE